MVLLQGCLGTKHLKENEKLLYRQSIEVPKGINKSALKDLRVIEPNKKFLGLRIHSLVQMYYTGVSMFKPEKIKRKMTTKEAKLNQRIEDAKNDKKVANLQFKKQRVLDKYKSKLDNGNLLMKWGEPLAIYDSVKVKLTEEKFLDYLFTNGYFNSKVSSSISTFTNKSINVTYTVLPGKPYVVDTIFYEIRDSTINEFVKRTRPSSFLKTGSRYEQSNFTKERERIDLMLKDRGFYDFSRQYVEFDLDTAFRGNNKIAVLVTINDPARRGYHKLYTVDQVNFVADARENIPGQTRKTVPFRNTTFKYYEKQYSLKILSQRTFIHPEDNYSRENTFNTQRQLANLDAFKFVNINYDTSGGKFVANIYTTAQDRFQWSNEVGMNVTQGFPGPFYNINFKWRNIFRGLENLEFNGRIGYEGVASATEVNNVYQSIDAGVNVAITFPQFLIPLNEELGYKLGRINPRTKALLGYSYTDRPEYIRSATTFNYGYSWENKNIRKFDLTLANLSIINSKTDSAFQSLLDSLFINEGNTLYRTFEPSFVSSIIFSMVWNHNNYGNLDENSVYLRWSFESGGTLQNFIDYPIVENKNLQSFRYLRANADLRRMNILDRNTTIAYRLNVGIGYSYDGTNSLPYEKYFFAGGSNSIRAWRPRRLGPGSWRPIESANPTNDGLYDYKYEQPGDILIESSVELRRKLFGFVEGAVFLDAGNVWTIKPRVKRDGDGNVIDNGNSQFKITQFAKEFGVGTGFGLRFNFSFLVLRFDVGMKVYDPARLEGDRFVLNRVKFFKPFGTDREPIIYNVGVGFPF